MFKRGKFQILATVAALFSVLVPANTEAAVAFEPLSISPQVRTVAPSNSSPPTVSGSASEGSVLSLSNGTWRSSPTSFAYTWYRCSARQTRAAAVVSSRCTLISGASTSSLTLGTSDVGRFIVGGVRAQNASGSAFFSSVSTAAVTRLAAPTVISAPVISGTSRISETLSISTGSWTSGPTSYSYTWFRCTSAVTRIPTSLPRGCTAISGATQSTYRVQDLDLSRFILGSVAATNRAGSRTSFTVTTGAIAQASRSAPRIQSAPKIDFSGTGSDAITGRALVGSVLVVNKGLWLGSPTPTVSHTYWYRCASRVSVELSEAPETCYAIPGSNGINGETYLVTAEDVNFFLAFEVIAINDVATVRYFTTSTDSVSSVPISLADPVMTGDPKFQGVLSVSNGRWASPPSIPLSFEYSWFRCESQSPTIVMGLPGGCEVIAGAESRQYTVGQEDLGFYVHGTVKAFNSFGFIAFDTAQSLGQSTSAPVNLAVPSISGDLSFGSPLVVDAGRWVMFPSPTTTSYQWYRCENSVNAGAGESRTGCQDISNAITSRYLLSELDSWKYIAVRTYIGNSLGGSYVWSAPVRAKKSQAIVISMPSSVYVTTSEIPINVSSSSALEPAIESGTPQTCEVDGLVLNILALGTCRLLANELGDTTYSPAPEAEALIEIVKSPQQILWMSALPLSLNLSDPRPTISASSSSLLSVEIDSLTPAVCEITEGLLVPLSKGVCTLRANQLGDQRFEPSQPSMRNIEILDEIVNLSRPYVEGNPVVGEVLSANPGTWQNSRDLTFRYEWGYCRLYQSGWQAGQRSCAVWGESYTSGRYSLTGDSITVPEYLPISGDHVTYNGEDVSLRFKVTACDGLSCKSVYSEESSNIGMAPKVSMAPTVFCNPVCATGGSGFNLVYSSGSMHSRPTPSATVPKLLTCTAPINEPVSVKPSFCTEQSVTPLHDSLFPIRSEYYGKYLSVSRTFTNIHGSLTTITTTTPRVGRPVAMSVAPTIVGRAEIGQTLSVSPGTYTGDPLPSARYSWFSCSQASLSVFGSQQSSGCNLVGTGLEYVVNRSDGRRFIKLSVSLSNTDGSTYDFTSATTGMIEALEELPTWSSSPRFYWGGAAAVGASVSIIQGSLMRSHNKGFRVDYSLARCVSAVPLSATEFPQGCAVISSASGTYTRGTIGAFTPGDSSSLDVALTTTSYLATAEDERSFLAVRVSVTNGAGSTVKISSSEIIRTRTSMISPPSISFNATRRGLIVNPGTWTGNVDQLYFGYYACNTQIPTSSLAIPAGCTFLGSSSNPTYTLLASERRSFFLVRVRTWDFKEFITPSTVRR